MAGSRFCFGVNVIESLGNLVLFNIKMQFNERDNSSNLINESFFLLMK